MIRPLVARVWSVMVLASSGLIVKGSMTLTEIRSGNSVNLIE